MPSASSAARRIILASLLLATAGCGWLKPLPTPILPPEELYSMGEKSLETKRYIEARESFKKIVERHPTSCHAARARFLMGESFYREGEFDKSIVEFRTFLSFYPRHQIADLVQYRLAMAHYDQIKPIEQDQTIASRALEEFKKLVKEYPESRYAGDALAKIDICRGRLAQKELWVAAYVFNQGNPSGARGRLELILKDYSRTLVIPEALWLLAEVNFREGKDAAGRELLHRLADDYPYSDFGRRAGARLRAQR